VGVQRRSGSEVCNFLQFLARLLALAFTDCGAIVDSTSHTYTCALALPCLLPRPRAQDSHKRVKQANDDGQYKLSSD
jgi:hypothetical protein